MLGVLIHLIVAVSPRRCSPKLSLSKCFLFPTLSRAQALLLCQLNTLAMDLPETSDSLVAFSTLAAMETTENAKSKKSKGKGKKRKRGRKGGPTDEPSAPTRPSDPLPDCRRTRLVDYLQPISTMLDACTVTKPPPADDNSRGGASVAGDSTTGKKAKKGFQSRAYDGTLADFMGLALVEHFAPRLAVTLGALFEDFECHPPDSLTAALAGTSTSDSGVAIRESDSAGNDVKRDSSKEMDGMADAGSTAAAKTVELHAGEADFSVSGWKLNFRPLGTRGGCPCPDDAGAVLVAGNDVSCLPVPCRAVLFNGDRL